MRNLKKFLALVLAMMMTLSLMVTANAATSNVTFSDSDTVIAEFQEDVTVLNGMGVIQGHGDTGTFAPKANITRGQMATIIYRMVTGDVAGNRDPYGAGYGNFSDVKGDEWFAGAVGYCANAGLIKGFPDGTYRPYNNVTGYQALAMILRAMGYNHPGDDFTGDDWAVTALSTATQRGMMVNIIKTRYNNTYSQAAPRELVAEMAFQGMIIPMVRWTNGGYERYGMEGGMLSSILNPTLGETYFGLTHHRGIIVGNTATGEADITERVSGETVSYPTTKIGFELDSEAVKTLNDFTISDGDSTTVGLTQTDLNAVINNDVSSHAKSYVYASGTTGAVVGDVVPVPENVTLAFKWESNLKQFGHAVDVWYDSRSNDTETIGQRATGQVSFPTNLSTYAVFDRVNAEATKVVSADSVFATNAQLSTDGNAATTTVGEALGYTTTTGNAYWNYAFGPTKAAAWGSDGGAVVVGWTNNMSNIYTEEAGATYANGVTVDFTSPVLANNSANPHGLYLAISNNAAGTPDLIVSLNVTISVVSQDNNTTAPLSTGIITENGDAGTPDGNTAGTNSYFDVHDYIQPTVGEGYSNIANDNMLDTDPIPSLRDKVAAVTITGTTGANYGGVTTTVASTGATQEEANNGNASKVHTIGTRGVDESGNSSYYYELKQVKEVLSGRAIEFNRTNQDVHIQGRTEPLHQSVFALAVDGSFTTNVNAPTEVGDYTFYLDEDGNYLFWEQGSTGTEFVYGTYMDYTSDVGSGLFSYPFIYVDNQGQQRQRTDNVTSMTLTDVETGAAAAVRSITDKRYTDDLMLPKRTNVGGNSAGFVTGKYIGYAMSGDEKTLTAVTPDDMQGTGFVQAGATATPSDGVPGTNGVVTKNFEDNNTLINGTSVNIGAVPVGNWDGTGDTAAANPQSTLFLTDETKFVIVNGAGTPTQTTDIRVGLKALIGEGNSSVEIESKNHTAVAADLTYLTLSANETNPYEMIYYSVKPFQYSQTYDPSAYAVDTVFIPVQLLNWTADEVPGNLYFIGDNNWSIVNNTGTYATRFTFYQNGVEHKMWIEGRADTNASNFANDADIVAELGTDVFYRLRDTGEKAHDGEPIYEILAVADTQANADKIIMGRYYDGTTTLATTSNTAFDLGATGGSGKDGDSYLATTFSSQVAYIGGRNDEDLWNVGSVPAGVLNLRPEKYTINSLTDLNNASSLSNNTGIPVSCVLAEKANTIQFIYVNFAYEI